MAPIDAEKALKDLLSRGVAIPPQPKVLLQLQQQLARDDYDVRSLAKTIAADPGISAMLFRVARPSRSSGPAPRKWPSWPP